MSNILSLDQNLLVPIYDNLNLCDKFTFAVTSKRLYKIFSKHPLMNYTYLVRYRYHPTAQFLFQNIVAIYVISKETDIYYIQKFRNLRTLDVSNMDSLNYSAKTLVNILPLSVATIYVKNYDDQETFQFAINYHERSCIRVA